MLTVEELEAELASCRAELEAKDLELELEPDADGVFRLREGASLWDLLPIGFGVLAVAAVGGYLEELGERSRSRRFGLLELED